MILGIAVIAVLIGLGTWQVDRLAWKEALLASIDQRTHAPPRPLAEVEQLFAGTGDVDYWPVELSGAFDHARERHFFATHDGVSGFYVYTPLVLPDGRSIFVNRGFVPYDNKEPATRAEGAGDRHGDDQRPCPQSARRKAVVDAAGQRACEEHLLLEGFGGDGEIRRRRPVDAAAVLRRCRAGPNPGGLPIGGVTIIDLPNSHLQYALTWYGLAAGLAGVLAVWLWRRRAAARGKSRA